MPKPRDFYISFIGGPLDDGEQMKAAAELWRAIGLAACTWSRLEQHVEVVLIHLNQREHSEKLYDEDHPIGFKRKIKLLKRWFNQHPALAEHRDTLRTITTDMLSLSVTRNTFLHSILDSYDPATSTATFRAVRPTSDTTYAVSKHVGTVGTLINFAGAVQDTHLRFARISTGLFTADAAARLRIP